MSNKYELRSRYSKDKRRIPIETQSEHAVSMYRILVAVKFLLQLLVSLYHSFSRTHVHIQ